VIAGVRGRVWIHPSGRATRSPALLLLHRRTDGDLGPEELDHLIDDMFETITLYENRAESATKIPGRLSRDLRTFGSGGPLRSPKEDFGAEHGADSGEVQGEGWDAGAGSVSIDMTRMTDMTGMTGQLYGLAIHRCCEFSALV